VTSDDESHAGQPDDDPREPEVVGVLHGALTAVALGLDYPPTTISSEIGHAKGRLTDLRFRLAGALYVGKPPGARAAQPASSSAGPWAAVGRCPGRGVSHKCGRSWYRGPAMSSDGTMNRPGFRAGFLLGAITGWWAVGAAPRVGQSRWMFIGLGVKYRF